MTKADYLYNTKIVYITIIMHSYMTVIQGMM